MGYKKMKFCNPFFISLLCVFIHSANLIIVEIIILTNINEADDVANFLNNKDKIVTSIVSGICSYLNIK